MRNLDPNRLIPFRWRYLELLKSERPDNITHADIDEAIAEARLGLSHKALPERCGLYLLANVVTGRSYVGRATNMRQRVKSHLAKLRCGYHVNDSLSADFAVYGPLSFGSAVLTHTEPGPWSDYAERAAIALMRERDTYNLMGVTHCAGMFFGPKLGNVKTAETA